MASRRLIIHTMYGPPANELPAVLLTSVVWRGDGIVIAIPSLYVYTTGAEATIFCRTRHGNMNDQEHVRESREGLLTLKADEVPVTLLGGEHQERGFTYRAWIPFVSNLHDVTGFTLRLNWPLVDGSTQRVEGVGRALQDVEILW